MIFKDLKKNEVMYNAKLDEIYTITEVSPIYDGGIIVIIESSAGGSFFTLSEDELGIELGKHVAILGEL